MKLTWSELKDSIPPLNLWNFPCWEVQSTKRSIMTLQELHNDKKQLGDTVYLLLKDFETKYGVCPSITITKDNSYDDYSDKKYLESVIVEVTL